MSRHTININAADAFSAASVAYVKIDGSAEKVNKVYDKEISREELKAEAKYMYPIPYTPNPAGMVYAPHPAVEKPRAVILKTQRTPEGYQKKRIIDLAIKGKITEIITFQSAPPERGSYIFSMFVDAGELYFKDNHGGGGGYVTREFDKLSYINFQEGFSCDYKSLANVGAVLEITIPNEAKKELMRSISTGTGREAVITVAVCMTENGIRYTSNTITTEAGIRFDTTNKPYFVATYEDVIVKPDNLYPYDGGYVNKREKTLFRWGISYDGEYVSDEIGQRSAVFRWKTRESETIHEISVEGARRKIEIPAGTFTADWIRWQVVVTSDDGVIGEQSEWIDVTTIDSISGARSEYPNNVSVDRTKDVYFSWEHIVETGTKQTKYDLQISKNNGSAWINLKTENTHKNGTIIPAGTFLAGAILWRVRTYNIDGVAGTWSEAAKITVREKPAPPRITNCTTAPRPTIKWLSTEQQLYEVTAGTYKSGIICGTEKEYKVPEYLSDGEVNISVRIIDEYGERSEDATAKATIRNTGQGTLNLTTKGGEHITLAWDGTQADVYYIYRDGELIGKTKEKIYVDYETTGKHRYEVRGAIGDNYILSNTQIEIAEPKTAVIAEIGVYDFIRLPYMEERAGYTQAVAPQTTYKHYAGRTLPVATTLDFKNRSWLFSYKTREKETAKRLEVMSGKNVIWKDKKNCCIGILESVSITYGRVIEISFTIQECSGEKITYD